MKQHEILYEKEFEDLVMKNYNFETEQLKVDLLKLEFTHYKNMPNSIGEIDKYFYQLVALLRRADLNEIKKLIIFWADKFPSEDFFRQLLKELNVNESWLQALENVSHSQRNQCENTPRKRKTSLNGTINEACKERIAVITREGFKIEDLQVCYTGRRKCKAKPYVLCLLGEFCRFADALFEIQEIVRLLNDVYRSVKALQKIMKLIITEGAIHHQLVDLDNKINQVVIYMNKVETKRVYSKPLERNNPKTKFVRLKTMLQFRINNTNIGLLVSCLSELDELNIEWKKTQTVIDIEKWAKSSAQFNGVLENSSMYLQTCLNFLELSYTTWHEETINSLTNSIDISSPLKYPDVVEEVIGRLPQNSCQQNRKVFKNSILNVK